MLKQRLTRYLSALLTICVCLNVHTNLCGDESIAETLDEMEAIFSSKSAEQQNHTESSGLISLQDHDVSKAVNEVEAIFSSKKQIADNEYDPFDLDDEGYLDSFNSPIEVVQKKPAIDDVKAVVKEEPVVDEVQSVVNQSTMEIESKLNDDSNLVNDEEAVLDNDQLVNDIDQDSELDEETIKLVIGEDDYDDEMNEYNEEGIADRQYRLQIGDKIYITIYGERNTGRVSVVDYTGHISYLLVDRIYSLGKTIDEVRRDLDAKIKPFFKHAFVTVTPVEFGGQFYTILGQVLAPGKKLLEGKETLLEAICKAGGFTTGSYRTQTIELADLGHAFLAREGDYVPVDFERLVMQGDMNENIDIESGDYIFIPNSLYREIYVIGEVKAPTSIGYVNTVSLIEAISEARGVTEDASSRAVVIRGSLANPTRYEIDINRIFKGKERDFVLQPGDIVFVPPYKFTNLEEVTKLGIRAFVSSVASIAGSQTFRNIHPHFEGDGPVLTLP